MSVNFTPEQKEYKNYKGFEPFKMFVLENFPFIAEDFDALTYYQMLCKIVEYLKDVIDNNKSIQDNQNEVLSAYNQLQGYINNYFDNLDVQNEVNIKLDLMATDGTLNRILNQELLSSINERVNNLENDLNDVNEDKNSIKEFIAKTPFIPQSRNIKKTTPKYINYNPVDKELTVIQGNNTGYLKYVFNTKNGDTSDASVGLAWDLIRLKKVMFSQHAYVFKNDYNSVKGTLTILNEHKHNNIFEQNMYVNNIVPLSENDIFYKNKQAIGIYCLESSDGSETSEVNYKLNFSERSGKASILFYCTSASSQNVDIIVDDNIIKNLNLSSFARNKVNCFFNYEFDIPKLATTVTNKIVDIVIRNNDLTNKMYFCCMNYMELKDYDGRDYDSFKATSSEQYYINNDGASDYAIYDSDLKKFMGSYHGGESAIQQQFTMPYYKDNFFENSNFALSNLPTEEKSFITTFFEVLQRTNLNNKGNMFSIFDFNSDGQIMMNFNFTGDVNTDRFFTALTCNSKHLDIVKFPDNKVLADGENKLIENNGLISFSSNGAKKIKMDILYSKFYDEHISEDRKNGYILCNNFYNKFYYGAIMNNSKPVNVKSLNFQKIMDFYTY